MKTTQKIIGGAMVALLVLGMTPRAQATHITVLSAPVGTVDAQVTGIAETLSVVSKNVSNNAAFPNNRVTFPAGNGVVSSPQYLEVSFQSNTLGAAVIIATDNHGASANPLYASSPGDKFDPSTGASGAGLVGVDPKGHGFTVPLLWAVYDDPKTGGYAFTGNLGNVDSPNQFAEAAVTDKAQTHVFRIKKDANGNIVRDANGKPVVELVSQPFDSALSLAYASIVVGMTKSNGENVGLIASFPEDIDGVANGLQNGLRKATSPIAVYLGADYRGAPAQAYSTNTLTLELIHQ